MTLCFGRESRYCLLAVAGLLWAASPAGAQTQRGQGPTDYPRPSGQIRQPRPIQPIRQPGSYPPGRPGTVQRPNQPVGPNYPTLQKRPPVAQPAPGPFRLSPQEQQALDRVLAAWERSSSRIKTFECSFTRWEFDDVNANRANPQEAVAIEEGKIKYARPDRGFFSVGGDRPEKWICDGKSIYQYDFGQKIVYQHKLPPELWGKAIADGPLPFIFGAEAIKLKRRYFMRLATTPADVKNNRVCIEALPRFQADAANFSKSELLLKVDGDRMKPYAIRIHKPGGKQRDVYQFHGIVVNDPLRFLKNPFAASTPWGWKKKVEEAPTQQVSRPPAISGRR